ncbi:MAG TPA: hypothetical protein VFQ44_08785 [Streptosporangiaceae bacterium]|nr:hypothetical protein [Streptosporangiaceae bacterium]
MTMSGRRAAFFDSYLTILIERDVRELAAIERRGELRRLLSRPIRQEPPAEAEVASRGGKPGRLASHPPPAR